MILNGSDFLTKCESKMLQGLSVLAMVYLHLFCTLSYSELFTPLIYIKGIPLAFYLAQLSDFCVMGFAFRSGYAHMALFDKKDYYKKRLVSLFSLYCNYWIILIAFTLICVIIGQADFMPGSVTQFLKGFTTVDIQYNGAWWYLPVYAVIVIISPLLLKASKRINSILLLIIFSVVYAVGYLLRYRYKAPYQAINWFGPFGMTIFEYMLGVICKKENVFEKIEAHISKIKPLWIAIASAVLFVAMLLGHTLLVRNIIVAPATGLVLIMILKFCPRPKFVEKTLLFFGKHSTNIWLTHMFFYLVVFKDLVYSARYPILIYIFMLAICVTVSFVINLIYNPLNVKIQKLKCSN